MKTFLVTAGAFALLQAAIAGWALWVRARLPATDDFLAASLDKHRRLSALPEPRVLFIGGSGTAFGWDSATAERGLGRNAVNMGVYARLGLEFMLNEVDGELRAGDLVVVSPEYPVWWNLAVPDTLADMAMLQPRALAWMDGPDLRSFLDHGHRALGAELRRILRGRFGEAEPESTPPYSRRSFDERGDMTAHRAMPRSPVRSAGDPLRDLASPILRSRISVLNEFNERCRARKVQVCLVYPPLPRETLEAHRGSFESFHQLLSRELRMPILGTPADMVQDADRFFDSVDHLAPEGARVRTELLLRLLKELR